MKTSFPNPIDLQDRKKAKTPWNFDAPRYDKRTSGYINSGRHFGVGHKNPVGHTGKVKATVPEMLPQHPRRVDIQPKLETVSVDLGYDVLT